MVTLERFARWIVRHRTAVLVIAVLLLKMCIRDRYYDMHNVVAEALAAARAELG